MKRAFEIILLAFALFASFTVDASTVYVSQGGAGSQNGTSAGNAYALSWLNTSGNWGAGGGQVGPGVTVYLEGTITQAITISYSGTPASPITIFFDTGAKMLMPGGGDNADTCFIEGTSYNNITINLNGSSILADNSGDELDNNGCNGIVFYSSTNIVIINGTIGGMFVRHQNNSNTSGGGSCVWFEGNAAPGPLTGNVVSNMTLHDAYIGIDFNFARGATNNTFCVCTIYNINWGIYDADTSSSSYQASVMIYSNTIYGFANWDYDDVFHHDGIFPVADFGVIAGLQIFKNVIGPGYGAYATACIYDNGFVTGVHAIYDNLLLQTDGTAPGDGLIYLFPQGTLPNETYEVLNNTAYASEQVGTAFAYLLPSSSPGYTPLMTFSNNIVDGLNTAIAGYYAQYAGIYSDYNDYYGCNPTELFSQSTGDSAVYNTWSQWNGTDGRDAHGTQGNPNLNGSYVPQPTSAAIASGADLSALFTTDLDGNSWPANGWGMGALAYTGSPPPLTASAYTITAASGTPTAGGNDQLTISLVTTAGATVTTFTGNKTITFSGLANAPDGNVPTVANSSGASVNLGTAETIAFTAGVSVTTAGQGILKPYAAQTATLACTDGTLSTSTAGGSGAILTVGPAAASQLAFSTQPGGGSGAMTWDGQPVVAVEDAYGNMQTSSSASMAVVIAAGTPTTGGPGTLSGTTTKNASGGIVTYTNLSINTAGNNYKLTATSSGLTSANSAVFNITVGAATELVVTTQPGGGTGGSVWVTQPAAEILDAGGNLVSGSSANVTAVIAAGTPAFGGPGTLSGTTTISASSGVVDYSGLSIDKVGTSYRLTLSSAGLTSATTSPFNVATGPAAQIVFSAQPGGGAAGSIWTAQPSVTLQDTGGNAVAGTAQNVTLTIWNNPSGGALSGTTTVAVNTSTGLAPFTGLNINNSGTGYTLTATGSTVDIILGNVISGPFNITTATSKLPVLKGGGKGVLRGDPHKGIIKGQ